MIRNRYFVLTAALILVGTGAAVLLFRDPSSQSTLNTSQELGVPFNQINDQMLNINSESSIRSTSFVIKEVVAASCDSVSLSWQSIDEASVVYDIVRADGPSFTPQRIASVAQNDTAKCSKSFCSFTDASAKPRLEHRYTIRARGNDWMVQNNAFGCDSKQSGTCPVVVQTGQCEMGKLNADQDVCKSVTLTWKSVPETASFRVYRSSEIAIEPTTIATVDKPGFEDSTIVADQEYFYSVAPVYTWNEEGTKSEVLNVKTTCEERKWEKK